MGKEFSIKWPLPLLLLLGVLLLSFMVLSRSHQKDTTYFKGHTAKTLAISIGHKRVNAFVADALDSQEKGLGGRDELAPDQAMLFTFGAPARYGIWMKDMKFPLDIFWLDRSGVIIFIKKDVSPSSYPEVFSPDSPAEYVLEANAGFALGNNLKIGDKISFSQTK